MSCPDDAALTEYLQDPAAHADVEAHLDNCRPCQELVGQLGRVAEGPLARGAALGRYLILDRLGQGAMGLVFAAFDPELDRKVALKLLTGSAVDAQDGRARLLREAQAMARVSHPNVLAVHDVGTNGEEVFIAMELVEGQTLASWMKESPRSWQETLRVFSQAGEGLAAAHDAGLVHRDFKPANVLIGRDGRVRVSDFGLVFAEPSSRPALSAQLHVTRSGSLLGTPAYMAPEQLDGLRADAASDQFSFCVALYEALEGVRPFQGDTVETLARSQHEGRIATSSSDRAYPSRLRRLVLRGLERDPAKRHPSMAALLASLDGVTRRSRSRRVAALATLSVVAAGAFAAVSSRTSSVCAGAESHLAGVWDAARRAAVHNAFAASNRSFFEPLLQSVQGTLDRYAEDWVTQRRDACEATRVRKEQTEAVMDARMRCLGQRLQELDALTSVLAHADGAVVDRALSVTGALVPSSRCSERQVLTSPIRPPQDQATNERVEALRKRIAEVKALHSAGKYADAAPLAAAIVKDAEAVSYPLVRAEALFQRGRVEHLARVVSSDQVERTLREAAELAYAEGDDELAGNAWALLVFVAGLDQRKPEQGRQYAALTTSAIRRLGGNLALEGVLAAHLSILAVGEGHYREATEDAERAVSLQERRHGANSPQLGPALGTASVARWRMGDYAAAARWAERQRDVLLATVGPDHPHLGEAYEHLGVAQAYLHDANAAQSMERAMAIYEKAFGPQHLKYAVGLHNAGSAMLEAGNPAQALSLLQRARAIFEVALPADHPDRAHPGGAIAEALLALGRAEEALAPARESVALGRKAWPPDHPERLEHEATLGQVLLATGRAREALPLLEDVAMRQAKAVGEDDPDLISTRRAIARARAALRRERQL